MNNAECLFGSAALLDNSWVASALEVFQTRYGRIHPYLVVFICSAGMLMNVTTMLVLIRPPMKSPVTIILFTVAGCDLIVMITYFVFVLHFLIIGASRCRASDYSFGWAVFTMFHAHTSVIFHATSIWLTVILAQIRILTLTHKKKGFRMVVSIKFTLVLCVITCFVMLLVNIPNILTFEIISYDADSYLFCKVSGNESGNASITETTKHHNERRKNTATEANVYIVALSPKNCWKVKLVFWTNGLCFKVLPCLLLTVSIIVLIKVITGVARKRRSLAKLLKRKKLPNDCISPILIVVLAIFLVTELPQGILLLLTGIFSSRNFHQQVYLPLGDFMDLLSLINSAVNFVIYCSMSKNFRRVLFEMLKNRRLSNNSFKELDNIPTLPSHNSRDIFRRLYSEDLMIHETVTQVVGNRLKTAEVIMESVDNQAKHYETRLFRQRKLSMLDQRTQKGLIL